MTIKLSNDDLSNQDQTPIHGAAEVGGRCPLHAGGPLLQCGGPSLGLHSSSLARWVRQARIDSGQAAPRDHGILTSEDRDELNRLRKENRKLRREKDFFILAAAHFAKEQLSPKGFA